MDWHTSLEALSTPTGQTPDISGMLPIVFLEEYLTDHEEKPFQQYIKEDHGEKPHQPYLSTTLDMGYHPELEIVGCIEEFEGQLEHEAKQVKFRVKIGDE